MDLLLSGTEPPQEPETWMKRYLKPILVGLSLLAALFLTLSRKGPDGGIGLSANKTLSAAPVRSPQAYDLTALKVFNVALVRVKDSYVDPKRIKPKKMLAAALDAVEKTVAEVLVEESPKKDKLKVKVDTYQKDFDISGVDSPWALSGRIKQILRFLQGHLLKGTEIRDVEYAAINGMLSTLDPHSLLLKPETYNEMKLSTRGEFGGLGIVISMVKGVLTVMNPMKGTPAEQVGIKSCDQILKIGEESTVNMTLTQAVNRLRGVPGSKVTVTLMRAGWTKPVRKTLNRAIIKVPSVKSKMLAGKVGVIQLNSFQGNSLEDMRDALDQMKRKQMKALILDLRGNPGGLLEQAIKISDLFIESGTLVTTVSLAGKRREEKRARANGTEPRYPIAVLVDSGSASASEIVAGALKNLDRAVIIGSRTFGKGTVQVLYDNDDGSALKLTIAEYLTPGDVSIQAVGVTPDVVTTPVYVRKDFIQLKQPEESRREKDLEQHLTRNRTRREAKPFKTLFYLDEEDKNKEKDKKEEPEPKNLCLYPDRECKPSNEDEIEEDFQVRVARDLLARARSWRRSQILAAAGGFFTKREAEQEQRVTEALKKLGVDWNKTAAPTGKPKLKVTVATEPKRGKANACEKMKIRVTVKNEGTAAASRLQAVSSSTNNLFDDHEFVFGKLEPGAAKSWEVPVSIRDELTRVDDVTLKFEEEHNNAPAPVTVPISIQGMERPTFGYAYQLIDDVQGNKDGRPQRGEKVRLFVKVKNTGKGTSFRTITTLKNLSGVGIFIRKGRFILGKLSPGASKSASFTLDVQNRYAMDEFKVELTVYDDALRENVSEKLKFTIVPPENPPQAATGNVRISANVASFRAWPAENAPLVGTAARGAVFQVVGRSNGWYHVLASKPRPAFVAAKDVTPGGVAGAGRFNPLWQVTPPLIRVKVPTYATTDKSIRIEGVAIDEKKVQDLFIFVRNPDSKVGARKIYYLSNRSTTHPKQLQFGTEVPLWPGANYVSIHARENEDVQTNETVVIFRKKVMAVAGKTGGKRGKKRGR
jgi:carboxyl-terminal processing protease